MSNQEGIRDSIQAHLISRGYTCGSDMMPTGPGVRYTVEVQSVEYPCEITVEGSVLNFYFTAPQNIPSHSRKAFCLSAMMRLNGVVSGVESEMKHYEALGVDYDVFLSVSHGDLDQDVSEFALKCMQAFYDLSGIDGNEVIGREGLREFQQSFESDCKIEECFAIAYKVSRESDLILYLEICEKEGRKVVHIEWDYPQQADYVESSASSSITIIISNTAKMFQGRVLIPRRGNTVNNCDFYAEIENAQDIHPFCERVCAFLEMLQVIEGEIHLPSFGDK